MPKKSSYKGKLPLEHYQVQAIRRFSFFTAALTEEKLLREVRIFDPNKISMHNFIERDKTILSGMWGIMHGIGEQRFNSNSLPGFFLLVLLLSELNVSKIGWIIQGEIEMPSSPSSKEPTYRAKWPRSLYPKNCLYCGNELLGRRKDQLYCAGSTCRNAWNRLIEQFKRLTMSPNSLIDEFGILFNAYAELLNNPHYKDYQPQDPILFQKVEVSIQNNQISLYKDKAGQAVNWDRSQLETTTVLITNVRAND